MNRYRKNQVILDVLMAKLCVTVKILSIFCMYSGGQKVMLHGKRCYSGALQIVRVLVYRLRTAPTQDVTVTSIFLVLPEVISSGSLSVGLNSLPDGAVLHLCGLIMLGAGSQVDQLLAGASRICSVTGSHIIIHCHHRHHCSNRCFHY